MSVSTQLLYLEDAHQLKAKANVIEILEAEGKTILILDQTLFYPQGGGQPSDVGIISTPNSIFQVEMVKLIGQAVYHSGYFEHGIFSVGENVCLEVNSAHRKLNSRLHSAGHLIDMAVQQLNLGWVPDKGYHFPQGPYVEYKGHLEGLDKEVLKQDLESLCNQMIQANLRSTFSLVNKDKLKEICQFVPDYIPDNKPIRIVKLGDFSVPCGGTHVTQLSEIEHLTIRKIKLERGNIRVSYQIPS